MHPPEEPMEVDEIYFTRCALKLTVISEGKELLLICILTNVHNKETKVDRAAENQIYNQHFSTQRVHQLDGIYLAQCSLKLTKACNVQ